MVCGLSLSHIHSQLYTLLSLKWGGQGLLPSSCLTCICQIYIVFPWHSIKNVPFQFSPPTPLVFYLPWRESCTIWWKKIARMEREGGAPLLRSQSADLLCSREKNEPTLLEADVDTVSVIEDGKSWLSHCSYKGVLMAVRDPVMDHLPICGRTAETAWNQKWSHSVILTCKRHQRLSLFGVFFFKPFPAECIMDIFQIILRLEREVKTISL